MARSDSNLIPPQLLELTDWSSERVCEEIFGPIANVWVYPLVHDHLPYGGVKESGLGREGVRSAMDESTDVKVLALS
jgi:acyl-CoA reductase-like NAD-dependent aldehyde dehydrogenase